MKWYYSDGNERLGPVSGGEWENLIASGKIQPDTLVWREGMADWVPFSQMQKSAAPAAAETSGDGPACAECGSSVAADDLVTIGGRQICSNCKPLVLQRMKEGAVGAVAEDPEAVLQQVQERDYRIGARSCIARGFNTVKGRFWLAIGTTFLCYVTLMAASAIPCGGLIVQGPIFGGLFWFFLKLVRDQDASIGDGFEGFNRSFVQLMLCGLVPLLLMLLCFVPIGVLFAIFGAAGGGGGEEIMIVGIGLGYLLALVLMVFMATIWLFSLPLVIDRGFKFWPAMEVSRKVVQMHFFQVFKLLLLMGLISFGIMLVFGILPAVAFGVLGSLGNEGGGEAIVGVSVLIFYLFIFLINILLLPVFFCAITHAYEDVFGGGTPEAN